VTVGEAWRHLLNQSHDPIRCGVGACTSTWRSFDSYDIAGDLVRE
jgi:hypothetical protein